MITKPSTIGVRGRSDSHGALKTTTDTTHKPEPNSGKWPDSFEEVIVDRTE